MVEAAHDGVSAELKLLSPVRWTEPPDKPPEKGTALCLSGGGYRAMLFHLGALWRLNKWGYLPKLRRVSSVSGGAITAGVLGYHWSDLDFDPKGVAKNFEAAIVDPIRALAGKTIDAPAVAVGLLLPGSINRRVTRAYKRHLFDRATLQDLPTEGEGPLFVINATNLQTGALWRFSQPFAADYRVGRINEPEIPLAVAVAASSAFPPFLAPARMHFGRSAVVDQKGTKVHREPYTTRPVLADGGVYDNLGLETAWKRFRTILISDGGGLTGDQEGGFLTWRGTNRFRRVLLWPLYNWRWRDWGTQAYRASKVVDNQVRDLRKRQAIAGFKADQKGELHRDGTYWGIRSHVADYKLEEQGLPTPLICPPQLAEQLAMVPTRLRALDQPTQTRLINWGYAICDTAMRRWVNQSLSPSQEFPCPGGIG